MLPRCFCVSTDDAVSWSRQGARAGARAEGNAAVGGGVLGQQSSRVERRAGPAEGAWGTCTGCQPEGSRLHLCRRP